MRTYPASFQYTNDTSEKSPRFVVGILFDTESLYFTSHAGIPNVPGVITEGVLTVEDATSQRIVPDEGRSEIGVVNFSLLDASQAVTLAFREKNTDALGLRGRTVELYHGWAGADFSQFQVFQTQVIASVSYNRGRYAVKCADITRELRKEIFDPKIGRLSASIDADDTTIPMYSTAGFEMIEHGDSYEDAPNATVGYIKIGDEKIRWTGKTSTEFNGCTRGVLNTRAVPHVVDVTTPEAQSTEVKEVVYLEMPAVKLILAIMTGNIYGQSGAVLPSHWHLGIDPIWVRESDFVNIGTDLWNTSADSTSFVPRFLNMKKTDGKKFLEAEVYQLIGCYPLVYSDGTVGIRRMNRVLANAPFDAVIDASNVRDWSALTYDMESVANDYLVQWNFNDDDVPTRTTRLVDGTSIDINGRAPQKILKFHGLYGSRHTYATIRARLDAMRDRYAYPPALQSVTAMPKMNRVEVGDIVRNRLPLVRDFMGTGDYIDRSMEVQRTKIDLSTGDVQWELFGSTGLSTTNPPDSDGSSGAPSGGEGPAGENNLPDAFYSQNCQPLSSVVSMTLVGDVWVVDAGTYTLTGDSDATSFPACYYHVGDLTIPDGVTIRYTQNVQLRVAGFLTINGDLDGIGRGNPGVAAGGYGELVTGTPGFGSSRAMDGISATIRAHNGRSYQTVAAPTTVGTFFQVPVYQLTIDANVSPPQLIGLPTDLRGTSGGPGGNVVWIPDRSVRATAGTGGAGGAGLIMIVRGLAIGASGAINSSGADSDTPPITRIGFLILGSQEGWVRAGAGAPGMPGGLLILLDGPEIPLPDLSGGRFLAITGASGSPRVLTMETPSGGSRPWPRWCADDDPWEGYLDPALTDGGDHSNAAYRVQYLPTVQTPVEDQPTGVPAPVNVAAYSEPQAILVAWNSFEFDLIDGQEVYMATSNDRAGSTKIAEVKATYYRLGIASGNTRYFWVRAFREGSNGRQYSEWDPSSPTGGAAGTSI